MKKKGFTLVELLAVIAILAILVIMALPAVLRMFNSARKDSFTNEVNTVIRTARQQYLLSGGTDTRWSNIEGSTKSLDLTGNSNLIYYVQMNSGGKITKLQVTNGDYQYNITNNNGIDVASSIDVEEVTDSNAIEVGVNPTTFISRANENSITAEDEVAIGTDHFYVVSSDENETVLLTKYDLANDGSGSYKQLSGSNIIIADFLNSNNTAYWDGCQYSNASGSWGCASGSTSGLLSPYSDNGKSYCTSSQTNCAYVYDENAVHIYPAVNGYANKIENIIGANVTGRLLKYEEASNLSVDVRKDMNGYYYWLGSAFSASYIRYVTSAGSTNNVNPANNGKGIRPVIIVPTSAMPN